MNLKAFAAVAIGVLLWYASRPRVPVEVVDPVAPAVKPEKPKKPLLRPRSSDFGPVYGADHVGGPEYNGMSVRCDLPSDLHLKNKGGSDTAGLCVFTSIDMAAQWGNVKELIGFRDWMTKYPGGGYPEKVAKMIAKLSKERGHELIEGVDWGQSTAADEKVLEQVLDGYRIACGTYGTSPRYGNQRINHMVCFVMVNKDFGVVLDNNFPGTYEWVERKEFVRRWKMQGGGWVVWLNATPPPPVPVNG